jgi:hypothetical protein
MLAAVLPDSAMDFPDGSQRFNWCNCQPSIKHLSGLGGSLYPSDMMTTEEFNADVLAASPRLAPRPQTPLVDFNFWESYLRGGGGPTATPDPMGADFALSIPGGTPVAVLAGAAAIGVVLWMTLGGKKGKR